MLNKGFPSSSVELPSTLIPRCEKGLVFVVSAPAGAGKTSLVYQLLRWFPTLELSVTYTTRKPREGEKDGVDYHFISHDEFDRRLREGDFLEHVELHGNKYGSSRSSVEMIRSQGKHAIMVIDTEGALKVKELLNPVMIFIKPPSVEVLKERMIKRGSETDESLSRRLRLAEHEMGLEAHYDYTIVNDDFTAASLKLSSVVIAETVKNKRFM